ncbi:MAG: nucleotidyl transferase AbiEii/AbiGii toxin family protein [Bacteroidales bacterium]|nr:nucleotidyl transferase AbiEii/AbiGii toxin family protein [Bacteroidales bacterium]
MIPRAYITEWQQYAPWQFPEQVEQDLIISQALINIYSDEFLKDKLAFRGGTALYKLFILPPTRYSEDIDLVQIEAGPVREIVSRLRKVLGFVGKPAYESTLTSFKLRYHYDSEIEPVRRMGLKVEVNSREHFALKGLLRFPFEVESAGFRGKADIMTYQINELLGTKLRALYQRKKGRDLYDLYKALTSIQTDQKEIIECYKAYMEFSLRDKPYPKLPSAQEFLNNLELKLQDPDFTGDTNALLIPGEKYDPLVAGIYIIENLINHL